jgi:hypothetical protein
VEDTNPSNGDHDDESNENDGTCHKKKNVQKKEKLWFGVVVYVASCLCRHKPVVALSDVAASPQSNLPHPLPFVAPYRSPLPPSDLSLPAMETYDASLKEP